MLIIMKDICAATNLLCDKLVYTTAEREHPH